VAAGATTAAPVTGGASGVVVLVAGAAAVASAAQCGISIGRVILEISDPGLTKRDGNLALLVHVVQQ
jgi:hypothetical protein